MENEVYCFIEPSHLRRLKFSNCAFSDVIASQLFVTQQQKKRIMVNMPETSPSQTATKSCQMAPNSLVDGACPITA